MRAGIAVAALVLALPVAARAQSADTLTLSSALELARQGNPQVRAARLQADAAAERVAPAGTLPDPQLTFGLMNRPLGGFFGTSEPMTMNSVQFSQMLPWPGKLRYARERARRLADAERLDADEVARDLAARVTAVYARLAYVDRALAVMDDTRRLLRSFLDVSSAMYAVGTGLQQDVLQAQVAVARMTEDIAVMRQERVAMASRLNALLGREATVSIGPLELAADLPDSLPAVDTLMTRAEAHRPALAAARARIRAAEAGVQAARRERYPDVMVAVSYGQRTGFDDMVSLMAGVTLPIRAGSRQVPMRREAEAMQAAEQARARDLWNETYARLGELRAEAERARALSALYDSSILPQARAAVQSALAAYRVGRVPYMTLVENQMTVNRYATERIRLAAEHRAALGEIAALSGAEPGEAR